MTGGLKRVWPGIVAGVLAIAGFVFVGLTFKTAKTTTTGHLLWKQKHTTEVALGTRILYLFIGLVLLAVAVFFVRLLMQRLARQAAQKKYVAILTGIETIPVQKVMAKTNADRATVLSDIQRMIDAGIIEDFYVDYEADRVVSKKYVPKTGHKTVVTCPSCGANNEVIVGITRPCNSCGEPLAIGAN